MFEEDQPGLQVQEEAGSGRVAHVSEVMQLAWAHLGSHGRLFPVLTHSLKRARNAGLAGRMYETWFCFLLASPGVEGRLWKIFLRKC